MGNVISFSSNNNAVKPFTRPASIQCNSNDKRRQSSSSSLICCKKRRVRPETLDNPSHKKVDHNCHLAAPALLLVNIGSAIASNNNNEPLSTERHPKNPVLESKSNSGHNIAMSLCKEETLFQNGNSATLAEKEIKSQCIRIWDLEDIEGDNLSQDNDNHYLQDYNVLETIKTSKEIVHVIISDEEEESSVKDKDTCINGVERQIVLKRDDYLEIESLTSEDSVDVYSMSEESFDVEASNEESPEDEDTVSINNERRGVVVGADQTLKKQLKKLDANAKHLCKADEIIAVSVYGLENEERKKDSLNENDIEIPQSLSERMESSNFNCNTREEELSTAQYEMNQENTDIMIIDLEEDENDENYETNKVRLSRMININKSFLLSQFSSH